MLDFKHGMLKNVYDNANIALHSMFVHMPAFIQYNGVALKNTLRDLRMNRFFFDFDDIIVRDLTVDFQWNRTSIKALLER